MLSSRPASAVSNVPDENGQFREASAEPHWLDQSGHAQTHRSATLSSDHPFAEPYFVNEARTGPGHAFPPSPFLSGAASPIVSGFFPNWYNNIQAHSPVNGPGQVLQHPPNQFQPMPNPISTAKAFPPQFHAHYPPRYVPNMGYPPYHYSMLHYPTLGLSAKMRPEDQQIDKLNEKDRLKTDGSNFFTWVTLVKLSLKTKGWLDYAEGRVPKPILGTEPSRFHTWERIDDLTKHQIGMNMDASMYHQLGHSATTAFDLWSSVLKRFEANNFEAQLDAELCLETKRIHTGESMRHHIADLRKLRDEYINRGGELSDRKWLSIIAKSLCEHPEWRREMSYPDEHTDPERFIIKLEWLDTQGYAGRTRNETAFNTCGKDYKRRTDRTSGNTSKTLCNHCKRGYHSFDDCWAPGGGGVHKCPSKFKPQEKPVENERTSLVA
ncbi:hypothetical protein ACEPAG_3586 [Sanghuangporus baumii]